MITEIIPANMTSEMEYAKRFAQTVQLTAEMGIEGFQQVPSSIYTPFEARGVTISLTDYISRAYKYADANEQTFLLAAVYLIRLQMRGLLITMMNVHKLSFTAIVLALKFLYDVPLLNSHYAQCAGISLKEMNFLEISFLKCLEFKLLASDEELVKAERGLKNYSLLIPRENTSSYIVPMDSDGTFGYQSSEEEEERIPNIAEPQTPELPSPMMEDEEYFDYFDEGRIWFEDQYGYVVDSRYLIDDCQMDWLDY